MPQSGNHSLRKLLPFPLSSRAKPRGLQFPMERRRAVPTGLSSRPERTRISCHAALDKAAMRLSFKERRMMFANATNFYRQSGRSVAEGPAVPF